MAGAIVQSGYAVDDSGNSSTTIAVTLTGVAAGNALVAFVARNSTVAINSVNDGASYTAAADGICHNTTDNESSSVYYLLNAGSGSHTVTVTFASDVTYRRLRVLEISGIATSAAADGAAHQAQNGVGTTTDSISSSATASTTNANDFILGLTQDTTAVDPGSGTLAAGTGYTLSGSNQILGVEYKNVSATGAQTATFTDTKNAGRTTHVLALKQTAVVTQDLSPTSDISDGAWTPSTGTDNYACVDEASYSDTDYIAATTATTCELGLTAGTDPASSDGHELHYRLLAGTGSIAVALKQGSTTIASYGPHTLTGAAQALQQTLSGGQADSITDYAALSVAITSAAVPNITYVGGQVGGRAGNTGTSNVTFALTGGSNSTPQAGDLVIIGCTVASQGRTPACAISGYTAQTQINANGTTYDTSLNLSYKFMSGTPDTTFTLPSTGNIQDAQRYTVQVWRGVDTGTPLDVSAVSGSGTATGRPNPGSITPTTTGAVVGIVGAGAAGTGASYTGPANYTTNFLTGTTSDTNDAMIGAGYRSWTSGAEDPAGFTGGTTNAADSWAAFTYALRPALTIDAKVSWIQFRIPASSSNTRTATTSVSAAVRADRSASASIAAAVRADRSASASIAAAVRLANTATASLAAAIAMPQALTVSVAAAIRAGQAQTASVAAAIQEGRSASASLAAAVQLANTATASLSAVVATQQAATASASAAIRADQARTASLSAAVLAQAIATATITAALRAEQTKTASLSAAVSSRNSATSSLTAGILEARAASVSLAAAVQRAGAATAAVDAAIQRNNSAIASADAVIRADRSVTASLDAHIEVAGSRSLNTSLSAAVSQANQATAAIDAAVRTARSAESSLDAAIQQPRTAGATVNAAVIQAFTASVSLSGAVQAAQVASASLSAYITAVDAHAVAATLTAAISEGKTATASLQAAIQAPQSAGVSLATAVAQSQAATADVSAVIQARNALDASLGAAVLAGRSTVAAIDCYIEAVAALSLSEAAILAIAEAVWSRQLPLADAPPVSYGSTGLTPDDLDAISRAVWSRTLP
jgi:hypothetical protein